MKIYLLGWLGLLVFILTACGAPSIQPAITFTNLPSATLITSVITSSNALQETKPVTQMTSTVPPTMPPPSSPTATPNPTWTPIPSFTPAPEDRTPAPPAECLQGGTPRSLTLADLNTLNMDESIRAYLNARGSAVGLEAILNMLTNSADPPDNVLAHVYTVDVTGDGVPDVVMDLNIPEAGSYATTSALIFVCREGLYLTDLFLLLSPEEGLYLQGGYQILSIEDMNQDSIREVVVVLKVFDNRRYYILAWDGSTFTSLIEPRFDEILLQTVYYVEAYGGEGVVMDMDGDDKLELVIAYNEEPSRREIWAWNGHAFVRLVE